MPRIVKNQRNDGDASATTCAFCGRTVPAALITQHHLLPKERGGKPEHREPFCKPCHKQIHAVFSNKQLAEQYASIDKLRAAPELATFLAWIRKQRPDRNFRTTTSSEHPRKKRKR
jgi:5-methylcytosine-specific restriction enzyme A